MAKIFITGIAGFLGSHLADALIDLNHEVIGNDNLIGGYLDNVPSRAVFVRCDCNDVDELRTAMRGCEYVIHTAATAYEGLSVFSPHFVTTNIVTATTGVASAAIANRVRRILFCSSMARYGIGTPPFMENDLLRPEDPYGIGKVAAEKLLKNICSTHNTEYAIAVPHNIIGPRQKYDDPYRNVASIMINRTLQGKPIIIYGDGEQRRCFSAVQECVHCILKMLFDDTLNGYTINIGPDEGTVSINELAAKIRELCGTNSPEPIYMPGRPQEVKYAYCSSNRARELLNYNQIWTLDEGLMSIIEYVKSRGVRPFDYHLPLEIENEKTPKTWTEQLF